MPHMALRFTDQYLLLVPVPGLNLAQGFFCPGPNLEEQSPT